MSDHSPTWMIDGKPGKILAALLQAQNAVENVGKQLGGNMAFQDADEVILVGTKALQSAEIAFVMRLATPEVESISAGMHVRVDGVVVLICPTDGSNVLFQASATGIVNKMGKYTAACNTACRKQLWLTALGISTGASEDKHAETEPPEETPETVEFLEAELEACQSKGDLRELTGTEEYKGVRGKWRSYLRQVGKHRLKELTLLGERGREKPPWPGAVDPAEFNERPKRKR